MELRRGPKGLPLFLLLVPLSPSKAWKENRRVRGREHVGGIGDEPDGGVLLLPLGDLTVTHLGQNAPFPGCSKSAEEQ